VGYRHPRTGCHGDRKTSDPSTRVFGLWERNQTVNRKNVPTADRKATADPSTMMPPNTAAYKALNLV